MKKTLLAGVSVAFALSTAAHAQSIDYGAMQQLFNEPVTTSATGSPQRSTAAPASMAIISAEDIKRSGAVDIPTILSRIAGIDVSQWGAAGADVGVRGYNQAYSPRLLVLIDGRQVYLDHYGYTAWATLPVQLGEIRQIEVVKGPNSALFGFNAVSGVINIITFNPKFDDVSGGSAQVGNHGYGDLSAYQTFKLGERISARLSAGARQEDEWSDPRGAIVAKGDPWRVNANLNLVAQAAEKTELQFGASWSNAALQGVNPTQLYTYDKYTTTSLKVALNSETKIGEVQAWIYQNKASVAEDGGNLFLPFENTVTVASLQDLFKIGANHTFRIGGELRDNKMGTVPVEGGEVSYKVYAISGLWNWAASEKLALTVSARHDTLSLKRTGTFPAGAGLNNTMWDRDINEVSYNLAAVYQATPQDTIRLTAARGVQAPSLLEFGGIQLPIPGGLLAIGSPTIKPSIVKNCELAYDHEFTGLNAKAGVSVFHQTTKDFKSSTAWEFVPPTTTTMPLIKFTNTGDSKMSGLEAYAKGALRGGYSWSVNYTYTDLKDTATYGYDLAATFNAFAATTPKSRLNASLGWARGPWEVDGFARYVSKAKGYDIMAPNALVDIDAYATLGGRVARDLGHEMTLSLSGQNLLDNSQHQTTGLPAQTRVVLGLSKRW